MKAHLLSDVARLALMDWKALWSHRLVSGTLCRLVLALLHRCIDSTTCSVHRTQSRCNNGSCCSQGRRSVNHRLRRILALTVLLLTRRLKALSRAHELLCHLLLYERPWCLAGVKASLVCAGLRVLQ